MDVEQSLEKFIVSELMMADDKTRLDPDESLIEKGVLDSLALLRLISFVEEQFGIIVDDGEVLPENFETLNVTASFIKEKLEGN